MQHKIRFHIEEFGPGESCGKVATVVRYNRTAHSEPLRYQYEGKDYGL